MACRPSECSAPRGLHRTEATVAEYGPAAAVSAALDLALPAQGTAVAIKRRHSRQRSDFAAVKPAQLGQVRKQRDSSTRPTPGTLLSSSYLSHRTELRTARSRSLTLCSLFAQIIDIRLQASVLRLGRMLEPVLFHH